ncbi:MAG: PAS domain-containing protein, partial [Arcobacter sp.]|nr:PAS domain-containing protein [Arcobacter sp.]
VDELIGKPHNIVRHKDMPKAAFKDLWDCVKQGKVWTGYVKNATKSGNYYWVFATVFPTTTSEGNKGFLSCRRKASQEEINESIELYEKLNRKEQ